MDDYRKLGAALIAAEREGESPLAIRCRAAAGVDRLPSRRSGVAHLAGSGPRGTPAPTCATRRRATAFDRWARRPRICWQPSAPRRRARLSCERSGTASPMAAFATRWERIAKRAKLKGVTLHTLRHSFATTANTLGCSEPTIAAMLGHSRGTMTSRYVHVVDDTLLAAADRVSGAIARAMAGEKPAKVVKIGDRAATRVVINFESARLGLAAEHPDRTGLPRRPLYGCTDTEVRDGAETEGADLVCATVQFGAGMLNPLHRLTPGAIRCPAECPSRACSGPRSLILRGQLSVPWKADGARSSFRIRSRAPHTVGPE